MPLYSACGCCCFGKPCPDGGHFVRNEQPDQRRHGILGLVGATSRGISPWGGNFSIYWIKQVCLCLPTAGLRDIH